MTFWDQSIVQLFQKGGVCMWPLLLCSILGVAIIVERAFFFLRIRFNYDRFLEALKARLIRRDIKEIQKICKAHPNPIPRVVDIYLTHVDYDTLRNEIIKREGSYALEKIEARLRALAAITHIAPLLGLLGTVTGLVTAFHKIEMLAGVAQPGDLAAGIWEALITTVYGLVIAIPCMAAYHAFESVADRTARRMQFMISELDEFFNKQSIKHFRIENPEDVENKMKAVQ